MTIHIVTDSTCDLPESAIRDLPINVIPLFINLNNRSYLDIDELSREEFYRLLPNAHPHPTTSAPSPSAFVKVYQELANNGATSIFSIHISHTLSAVINSAQKAAQEFNDIPVHVIDSGNLSMAEGLIVYQAAIAAKEGKSEAEITALLEKIISRTFAFAKLDTIDYLLKGGRITAIQHNIIGFLGIKPILKMNNGISRMDMARTKAKAFNRVLKVATDHALSAEVIGITHADCPDQVAQILEVLASLDDKMIKPLVNEVTPTLGSHVGPGALCINWIEKEHQDEEKKKGLFKWL